MTTLWQDDSTVIERVRIRSRLHDSLAAQQRIGDLLRSAELRSSRLPASATLVVRHLRDPLPRTPWLTRARVRLPNEWEESVTRELDRFAAGARRPALAPVPSSAGAVVFLDRSELLACLAADWLQGTMRSKWWWSSFLRQSDPEVIVSEQWTRSPESIPSALEMLARSGHAVEFLLRIPEQVVSTLLERVLRVHAVPQPYGVERQEWDVVSGSPSATFRESHTPKRSSLAQPWLPWVPEGRAPLSPLKQLLLAQALMLRRAPATARTAVFQEEIAEWRRSVADHPLPRSGTEEELQLLPESAVPHHFSTPEQTHDLRNVAQPSGTVPAEPKPPAPEVGLSVPVSLQPENFRAATKSQSAAWQPVPEIGAKPTRIQEPAIPASTAEPRILPAPTPGVLPTVDSEFGGVFFLLNVALYLKLYGDFTSPERTGLELNIWDFICLLGLELIGPEMQEDALFEVLASLSGRTNFQRPGSYFIPADEWQLPPEWLEPFPEVVECQEIIHQGRVQVMHPAGFYLSDRKIAPSIEPVDSQDRWLKWISSYARARLARALGRADAAGFLCRIPARIAFTSTHVDVFYSLSTYPIEIRLAGLDRDPGWIPVAGRFVAFHFE